MRSPKTQKGPPPPAPPEPFSSARIAKRLAHEPSLDAMKIVALLGQKGGSGKTTIALGLADVAASKDLAVSVIDLDPQRSAEQWSDYCLEKGGDGDVVVVHGTPANLDSMIEASRDTDTDIVFIDTPGQLDKHMVYAAAAAELVVVPTRSGILDSFALRETLDYLKRIGALPKTVLVHNAPSKDVAALAEIERLAVEFSVRVMETMIDDDKDYAVSLRQGKTVSEFAPRRKAASAMRRLYEELMRVMASPSTR